VKAFEAFSTISSTPVSRYACVCIVCFGFWCCMCVPGLDL
jgi:hypothetical protein